MVCSDSYSFNFNNAGIADFTQGLTGTNCAKDYLVIESKTDTCVWIVKKRNLQSST
jgi:hypothetical protein